MHSKLPRPGPSHTVKQLPIVPVQLSNLWFHADSGVRIGEEALD